MRSADRRDTSSLIENYMGFPEGAKAESRSRNLRQPMTTAVMLKMKPHPQRSTIKVLRSIGRAFKAGISILCKAL
jgi:hypothetical protein